MKHRITLLLALLLALSGCPAGDDDDATANDDDITSNDDDATGDDDDATGDDDDATGDDDDATGDDDDDSAGDDDDATGDDDDSAGDDDDATGDDDDSAGDDDDATGDDDDATPDGDDDDSAGDDDDATGDDDDATGDDDDSAGDDDDATGDDDDSAGDDDDSAGDDDDSAGDDDDSAGDDDDSAAGYAWENDIYCLDWSSVTWVQPSAALMDLAGTLGLNLTDLPMLVSPLAVGPSFDLRISGATAGTCSQDLSISTIDTAGTWADPDFDFGPVDLSFTLTAGNFSAYDTLVDGTITGAGAQITDSSLTALMDVGSFASTVCSLITCVPCPVGGTTCVNMEVTDAIWDNVGAGPLLSVP